MPGKIYKRNCNHCNKYYEGRGKYFCSYACAVNSGFMRSIGFQKGHPDFLSKESRTEQSETIKGKGNPHWKGGYFIKSSGYIMIHKPNHPHHGKTGYILEHRLVAEKCLRRYLTSKEQIHHINGKKTDNRAKNLYLFSSNIAHIKFHHLNNNIHLKSNLI